MSYLPVGITAVCFILMFIFGMGDNRKETDSVRERIAKLEAHQKILEDRLSDLTEHCTNRWTSNLNNWSE